MTKTRYQILFPTDRPIENYTAAQKDRFLARCAQLTSAGVAFRPWDTQKNRLAALFRI